jgi:hypothetical protein
VSSEVTDQELRSFQPDSSSSRITYVEDDEKCERHTTLGAEARWCPGRDVLPRAVGVATLPGLEVEQVTEAELRPSSPAQLFASPFAVAWLAEPAVEPAERVDHRQMGRLAAAATGTAGVWRRRCRQPVHGTWPPPEELAPVLTTIPRAGLGCAVETGAFSDIGAGRPEGYGFRRGMTDVTVAAPTKRPSRGPDPWAKGATTLCFGHSSSGTRCDERRALPELDATCKNAEQQNQPLRPTRESRASWRAQS